MQVHRLDHTVTALKIIMNSYPQQQYTSAYSEHVRSIPKRRPVEYWWVVRACCSRLACSEGDMHVVRRPNLPCSQTQLISADFSEFRLISLHQGFGDSLLWLWSVQDRFGAAAIFVPLRWFVKSMNLRFCFPRQHVRMCRGLHFIWISPGFHSHPKHGTMAPSPSDSSCVRAT